ncbi:hypothetical protein FZEAL_5228 [Fusarium zealandicum]|uniref:Uncharacterized protein n=1 Tax=Fusarium zealandicum TaxID=1053134 RepID=A0A8H4UKX6_9HYPO|nr:hypothetical protein FZEAL_5228 [Fusarium zealandicum]
MASYSNSDDEYDSDEPPELTLRTTKANSRRYRFVNSTYPSAEDDCVFDEPPELNIHDESMQLTESRRTPSLYFAAALRVLSITLLVAVGHGGTPAYSRDAHPHLTLSRLSRQSAPPKHQKSTYGEERCAATVSPVFGSLIRAASSVAYMSLGCCDAYYTQPYQAKHTTSAWILLSHGAK